jgi:hypothetical protein
MNNTWNGSKRLNLKTSCEAKRKHGEVEEEKGGGEGGGEEEKGGGGGKGGEGKGGGEGGRGGGKSTVHLTHKTGMNQHMATKPNNFKNEVN